MWRKGKSRSGNKMVLTATLVVIVLAILHFDTGLSANLKKLVTAEVTQTQIQKQTTAKDSSTTSVTDLTQSDAVTASAPAKPASVKIISESNPIVHGGLQTVVAQVPPHSTAHIEVDDYNGAMKSQNLDDKVAGDDGKVSWTWRAEENTGEVVAVTVSDDSSESDTIFQIQ